MSGDASFLVLYVYPVLYVFAMASLLLRAGVGEWWREDIATSSSLLRTPPRQRTRRRRQPCWRGSRWPRRERDAGDRRAAADARRSRRVAATDAHAAHLADDFEVLDSLARARRRTPTSCDS